MKANLSRESSDLGDALDVLIRFLDLPRELKQFDISAEHIPGLARNTLEDFWAGTNPVPLMEVEQVEEILGMVA